VFGTVSQVLVIHLIRTAKIPFAQSKPSAALLVPTLVVAAVTIAVGFSALAVGLDMSRLPVRFIPWLLVILAGYGISAQLIKKAYIKRYGEWL
jgi:Mg2+-importing ATPase